MKTPTPVLIGIMLLWPAAAAAQVQYHIPYFLSASNPDQQSFVRLVWPSCRTKPRFSITAMDDLGELYGPIEIPWQAGPKGCGRILAFNSDDLEYGNPDKGISVGVGQGSGDWQLFIESSTTVTVQSFVRTSKGFLTAMHDRAPFSEDRNAYYVATFNPGKNTNQRSRLRIINPHDFPIEVTITGQHDNLVGSYDGGQAISMSAREVVTITAQELETFNPDWADGAYDGKLGGQDADQAGKWRLYLQARVDGERQSLIVMHLMETPGGHLTNLSSIPDMAPVADPPTATESPPPDPPSSVDEDFDIELMFVNGVGEVPPVLERAYTYAAERWEQVITQGFPDETVSAFAMSRCGVDQDMTVDVDDLLVIVRMSNLGGSSGPAARAAPCASRDSSRDSLRVPLRPFVGQVRVNSAHWVDKSIQDLVGEPHPLAVKIAIHELGHLLGFSSDIIRTAGFRGENPNPHFRGSRARSAFQGSPYDGRYEGSPVPMESGHAHWHQEAFTEGAAYPEIMAPIIAKQSLLSEVTIGALADLGYEVDFSQADPLPWGGALKSLDASEMVDLSQDAL